MMKKVLVTGSFDMLHSGHVTFLKEASKHGKVFVGIGSDESIKIYKGESPVCPAPERLFMLRSLKYVHYAFVNAGKGPLDFLKDLNWIKPDIMIVNNDQQPEQKAAICKRLNIEIIILERFTIDNLPQRSTTQLRNGT